MSLCERGTVHICAESCVHSCNQAHRAHDGGSNEALPHQQVKGFLTVKTLRTDVCVIGGGSTGAGVVRDVAMRGFSAVLVDRADIAQGTSGRFHGLLHSGGRYIASDPESATEYQASLRGPGRHG